MPTPRLAARSLALLVASLALTPVLAQTDAKPRVLYDRAHGENEPVPAKRIRQLVSIFQDTDLEDALAIMRRSGAHLARAFNTEGETTGVLFLEDIIEELVGEVQDATQRR